MRDSVRVVVAIITIAFTLGSLSAPAPVGPPGDVADPGLEVPGGGDVGEPGTPTPGDSYERLYRGNEIV